MKHWLLVIYPKQTRSATAPVQWVHIGINVYQIYRIYMFYEFFMQNCERTGPSSQIGEQIDLQLTLVSYSKRNNFVRARL